MNPFIAFNSPTLKKDVVLPNIFASKVDPDLGDEMIYIRV